MKYKITYVEGDVINKTCEIEAGSRSKALITFWVKHPEASDVSKVERVFDDEQD